MTSVVDKTPSKVSEVLVDAEADETPITDKDCPNGPVASEPEGSDDSESEEIITVSKPPRTKLFSNISIKRSAAASPEENSENKKKDKKIKKTSNSASTALRSSVRTKNNQ